jgi:hypothetical protein
MQRETHVDFTEVKNTFLRDNIETPERNPWPLGALEVANRQFGTWTRVILTPDELCTIMLPWHVHGVNLVPADGLIVSEAIKRLGFIDSTSECYRRIQQFSGERMTAVFLSAAPINDPSYPDYRGLLARNCRGLTHLDGLHRLIAWGREKRQCVPAYVAGLA